MGWFSLQTGDLLPGTPMLSPVPLCQPSSIPGLASLSCTCPLLVFALLAKASVGFYFANLVLVLRMHAAKPSDRREAVIFLSSLGALYLDVISV